MNIPTYIYIYILVLLCILVALIGIAYYIKTDDKIMKIGIIWYIILMEINLINMIYIVRNYKMRNLKVGLKGPTGDIGPVGIQGDGIICGSSCGDDGRNRPNIYSQNYYLDISGKRKMPNATERQNVKMGKCKFPFIYDHQKFDRCITPKDNYKIDIKRRRNTGEQGWCPTSLTNTIQNGSNVKTWGYCKSEDDSLLREREIQIDNRMEEEKNDYIRNNSGILDLQIVMGNRSNVSCPSGYRHVLNSDGTPADMNLESGGKYVYLCKKEGLASEGIIAVTQVDAPDKCIDRGPNYSPVRLYDPSKGRVTAAGNLNQDVENSDPLYLCKGVGDTGFLTDIRGSRTPDSNSSNPLCSVNMNPATQTPIYICPYRDMMSANIIDTALFYNKELYFFFNDYFFKYDYISNTISKDKTSNEYVVANINRKWGNMKDSKNSTSPLRLDGAFTWIKDNKTYFFKDNRVYLYDDKKMAISQGYPKEINQVFPGIPSNIDAVFTWHLDNKTYFFKGAYFYRFDDRNNKLESGYPKLINRRWIAGNSNTVIPTNITAVYSDKRVNKTYMIQGTKLFEVDQTKITHVGEIGTKYVGLSEIIGCLLKSEDECEDPNTGCRYLKGKKMCVVSNN